MAIQSGTERGKEPPSPSVETFRWYAQKWERATGESSVPFSDALRPLMSSAMRLRAKRIATRALAPEMRRRAARLARCGELQLHLGCGQNNLAGWVNIDLVGAKTDLDWDILRPLPFSAGCARAVFLEHVLEHMTYAQGMTVLAHVRRVLAPGGTLRIGQPDAGLYVRLYVEGPEELRGMRWGRPTAMLALREVFQEHGHLTAWDGETLLLVLEAAGFVQREILAPGVSNRLRPVPDLKERWQETVYAEAVRPL